MDGFFLLLFFFLFILGVPWLLFSLLFSIFFLEMAIKYHVTLCLLIPKANFNIFSRMGKKRKFAGAVYRIQHILAGNGRHLEYGIFHATLFTHLRPFALLASRIIHRSSQTPFPFRNIHGWMGNEEKICFRKCRAISVCTTGFLGFHFVEWGFYREKNSSLDLVSRSFDPADK